MKSNLILICLLAIVVNVESRDLNSYLFNNLSSINIDLIEHPDLNCSTIQGARNLEDTVLKDTVLSKPFKLDAICDCNSIIWHWGGVDKAKGYKINFVNDINSATDLFSGISFTQQKLASNKIYNLYVWAYNDSLISEALHIEARTLALTCGCMLYDERDNEEYKTVQIGNQCWMGENLRYSTDTGSICFYKNKKIVEEYGRYYNYYIALKACPQGWRLPTLNDINLLNENCKGGPLELYKYLTGEENSGLNIVFGGFCDPTSKEMFKFVGASSGIWFSDPERDNKAYILFFYQSHRSCHICDGNKLIKYNVRCVKENN
jgi:uncharacterized protein (TIGR02145 family)